jgi:hypothetical protein
MYPIVRNDVDDGFGRIPTLERKGKMITVDQVGCGEFLRAIHEEIQFVGVEVRQRGERLNAYGGYCCLRDSTGQIVHQFRSGQVASEKADRFDFNSREKGERRQKHTGHISSFQSADTELPMNERKAFAGEVLTDKGDSFSMSGYPEQADETAMLFASMRVGSMSLGRARTIAGISKNLYYRGLEADFIRRNRDNPRFLAMMLA